MNERSKFEEVFKSKILDFQSLFRLYPKEICLITGAPRSGTSALCKWLGSQPAVSAFPESRILVSAHKFLEEANRFNSLNEDSLKVKALAYHLVLSYYSKSRILIGKKLLIDKEPLEPIAFPLKDYSRFILNVRKIFPSIKLLFAIRDPLATIWSMSQRSWGESLRQKEARRFSLEEYIENWCSCADLILQYQSEPNTYVVQFGNLITNPSNETRNIFNFLKIHSGQSFQPSATKEIEFNKAEREIILHRTQSHLKALKTREITNL